MNAKREKTLFASLLLSLWAPLATGVAVFMSRSTTQVADFIRRTMELLVLLLSWLVFRYLITGETLTNEMRMRWEKVVNLAVAASLGCSGLIMLFLSLSRLQTFRPGGNVTLGLTIATLGLIVNLWFWRRYRALGQDEPSPIIDAQRRLYLAKIFVDMGVILALSAVAIRPATKYIDILGSIAVALYLVWSSFRALRTKQGEMEMPKAE